MKSHATIEDEMANVSMSRGCTIEVLIHVVYFTSSITACESNATRILTYADLFLACRFANDLFAVHYGRLKPTSWLSEITVSSVSAGLSFKRNIRRSAFCIFYTPCMRRVVRCEERMIPKIT